MDHSFEAGRVVGGSSIHAEEKVGCRWHLWRTVDCGEFAGKDRDIVECYHCGRRRNVPCSFDDDYA